MLWSLFNLVEENIPVTSQEKRGNLITMNDKYATYVSTVSIRSLSWEAG